MAKSKKSAKASKKHEMIDTKTESLMGSPVSAVRMSSANSSKARMIAIALLVILAAVALVKKGYVVAAVVNGKPIFRWELNAQLANRFGAQTLDSMITEKLIADAAKKQGIEVTQADIDAKVMTITQTLGENVNLEELLQYQGMTKADFEHQVRLQLTVEKVLGKDVAVEESEIDTFISANRETMSATDEASLRQEAKDTLVSQKTSEKMQPWLMELRENAKVTKLF
jgi:foldase protein PrsA